MTCGRVWLVTHVTAWLVRLCHCLHVLDRLCHCLHALKCLCHCLHALRCLCHRLHVLRCDWFLHDTWQISVGFWVVIAKSSSNTWCFVIGCILWTWYCDVSTCDRLRIFPFYKCPLETRSRIQFWSVVWEWVSKTDFFFNTGLFKWRSWRWWSFQHDEIISEE